MNCTQAEFFRETLLPIIRVAAGDDPDEREPNPLRPMLRQLLRYVDYLEAGETA